MGKRKFYTGIVLGAVVGGMISLINKDARQYAKQKLQQTMQETRYYVKHPSEAVRNVRVNVDQFNQKYSRGVSSTINTLEQIEETLDKLIKHEPDSKRIE